MDLNRAELRGNRFLGMGEVLDRFPRISIGMGNLHSNPSQKYVNTKTRGIDIHKKGERKLPRMKENRTESVSRTRLSPELVFLIVLGSNTDNAVSCISYSSGFRSSATSSTIVETSQNLNSSPNSPIQYFARFSEVPSLEPCKITIGCLNH